MQESNKTNFAVSGRSGAGASTLALLLTDLFEVKYMHNGGIFRELGKKLGYSEEGSGRPAFDDFIEPIIGPTVNAFTDYALTNKDGILVEGDYGAFGVGKHPKVISVFVTADFDTRIKRIKKQGRDDAEETMKRREEVQRDKYPYIWDEELIERKFNIIMDNSHLRLEEEINDVLDFMSGNENYDNRFDYDELRSRTAKVIKSFETKGKEGFRDYLAKKDLIIPTHELMRMIATTFPEDIAQFPDNVRDVFLGQ